MGDIADSMLDGTVCEACGAYIDDEAEDFPRYCSSQCAKDRGADYGADYESIPDLETDKRTVKVSLNADTKIKCPVCARLVRAIGFKDHQRDAHGVR